MRAIAAGVSDVGRERDVNEDRLLLLPEHQVFVVADGMGGHHSGEVASHMAVTSLARFFAERGGPAPVSLAQVILTALRAANEQIFQRSMSSNAHRGMGTTVVLAALDRDRRKMVVGHAGDSRCYLLRGGRMTRLTRDHSLVEETLRQRPDVSEHELAHLPGNVITRALGVEPGVEAEVAEVPVYDGDRFLLCSDGLHGFASEDAIEAILRGDDALATSVRLVDEAHRGGGGDNVTVLVIDIEGGADLLADTDPGGTVVIGSPASDQQLGAEDTAELQAITDPDAILAALEGGEDD